MFDSSRRVFAIAIACTMLFASVTSKSAPAPQQDTRAKGLVWLAAQQKEDGSFSHAHFPALTGLALWAFTGSGDAAYAPQIEKAIAFIKTKVQPDGGIYQHIPERKGGGLSTYNTAICLSALASTGRADLAPIMRGARAFLQASQEMENDVFKGGFGYDAKNKRPYADLMNTHFTIEAMRLSQYAEDTRPAGEAKADINWELALNYVLDLQNKPETGADHAGGFFYNQIDPKAGTVTNRVEVGDKREDRIVMRSYGSITYAGLLSLIHAQLRREDPRVRSALDWASRHWTLEENPGMGEQGLYFFYNIIARSMNATGLDRLPQKDGQAGIDWRAELRARLANIQQADGSWVNTNNRFQENNAVMTTSYALIALNLADKP